VRVLTTQDIISIVKYLIGLINSKALVDDIDHLSNRRVRTVGEQLYAQFGVGLARMARTIKERMNVRDNEDFKPVDLINARTLSSVINSFFGTNQLSQFMDQTNPLAEITHKRRMSALGPVVCPANGPVSKYATCTTRTTAASAPSKRRKVRTSV
jgi:DNA-directed RNA polymerase subunit beta